MTSEIELFIKWLYIPHDNITINKVIDLANKYNIPSPVVFFKYALYLKKKGNQKMKS